jgi:hypothetical protein
MKANLTAPVIQVPSTVTWRPVVGSAEPQVAERSIHQPLCLECRYAELFAEQPRARCTCAESAYTKRVVFAGQPACAEMKPRGEDDLTLAWCSPGLKAAHARFVQPRPRVH